MKIQTSITGQFRDRVRVKINSARDKGYIGVNDKVMLFTNFFPVVKTMKKEVGGEIINDIRMVYDATKSGLNDVVWDPLFSLPTIESELWAAKVGMSMCDCDVGEIFLNFMLEPKLRYHTGVDVFQLHLEKAIGMSNRLCIFTVFCHKIYAGGKK